MSDFLTFVITKHSRVDVELAYMEPITEILQPVHIGQGMV